MGWRATIKITDKKGCSFRVELEIEYGAGSKWRALDTGLITHTKGSLSLMGTGGNDQDAMFLNPEGTDSGIYLYKIIEPGRVGLSGGDGTIVQDWCLNLQVGALKWMPISADQFVPNCARVVGAGARRLRDAPRGKEVLLDTPEGRWRVKVPDRWTWIYEFKAGGTVTWTDPLNNQTGQGKWKIVGDHIVFEWPSGAVEQWNYPVRPSNEDGSYRKDNVTYDLQAVKL